MAGAFSYETAFSRNLGWLGVAEQKVLRRQRIAIAGMGGVGGNELLTLTRLGVGAFHLADFDQFELANFNRQAGATMSSLGQSKLDVMARMAQDINPELNITRFAHGIDEHNLSAFLDGVDLYVDALDFFAFSERQATFALCARLGVPAITVAPLGMSAALLNFLPGQMSFESYFRWGDQNDAEKALRFLVGLAPGALHAAYLVDPSTLDLAQRRGPSTAMGCQLCAGIAATEALKILLGRGKVWAAPHALQFDAYRNKLSHTWRPGGNAHPLQRLAMYLIRRRQRSAP